MTVCLPNQGKAVLLLILSTFLFQWVLVPQGERAIPRMWHRNISVLLWYWPFGKPQSLDGDVCWDRFAVRGCRLTDERSRFPEADVVVFHHHELKTRRQRLPRHLARPAGQKWLWMTLESPASNGNLSAYDGAFNWTMTYRRDADVFLPYGELAPKKDGGSGGYVIPKKDAGLLACWVVSNFRPRHKRTQVYQSLRKLIPVEVYGRWPRKPLSAQELLPAISRCRFYLAFENSLFADYITEKLWRNSFLAGTVPVVLGPPRSDYEAAAPPSSFIHVDDFNSTEALAALLRRLASDEKAYASYFEWRRDYDVRLLADWRERLCRVCELYDRLPVRKVYHHLDAWNRK
ncbi:alpha-(1,3)-fucosyltransferase 7 isoform X1 [Anguilla anguilla]|uniref:alpha-(1,3)-fucosyltransferase 7 isoform X1 n=2 Tax=Anguilla anguilla TaxID=7936 RepID=UPI0015AE41E7|nr:alpha-(1,3)-fucosyltransferase 7 isoform X1 [Anguilla anguilla]